MTYALIYGGHEDTVDNIKARILARYPMARVLIYDIKNDPVNHDIRLRSGSFSNTRISIYHHEGWFGIIDPHIDVKHRWRNLSGVRCQLLSERRNWDQVGPVRAVAARLLWAWSDGHPRWSGHRIDPCCH